MQFAKINNIFSPLVSMLYIITKFRYSTFSILFPVPSISVIFPGHLRPLFPRTNISYVLRFSGVPFSRFKETGQTRPARSRVRGYGFLLAAVIADLAVINIRNSNTRVARLAGIFAVFSVKVLPGLYLNFPLSKTHR